MTLEVKDNLLKMICSLPSRVLAFPGGLSHPEMFCVDDRGNNNLRSTRSNESKILVSFIYFVLFSGSPKI